MHYFKIMKKKNLLQRVVEESSKFNSSEEAALDHLKMAHATLFESFEGRNHKQILSRK